MQIESTDARGKTLSVCAIEPAGPVVLPTPWAAADLSNVRYDQSLDVVYVACYGQQQQMIQRRGVRPGARGWSVVIYRADDGPFQASPGIQANFTPSAYYGNGTLTSDRPWFQPGHVGALFRLFSNGQFNQAAATTVTACLGYVAPFMSAKLAYGAQLGSALTQKKRIDHLGLVLYDAAAQGLAFGQRFDVLDNLPLFEAGETTPFGTTWSSYDQPMIEVPGSWNTDARLCLLAQAPNPVTVGAVVVALTTNERT
jgi:hypothetical protein